MHSFVSLWHCHNRSCPLTPGYRGQDSFFYQLLQLQFHIFLRLYGTERAFMNTGVAPSLKLRRSFMFANLLAAFCRMLGYLINREPIFYCFRLSLKSLTVNFLTLYQSIGILLSQFLLSSGGPLLSIPTNGARVQMSPFFM